MGLNMHFLKPRLQPMPLKFTGYPGYHRTQVPGSIGLGDYRGNQKKEGPLQDVYVTGQEKKQQEKWNNEEEAIKEGYYEPDLSRNDPWEPPKKIGPMKRAFALVLSEHLGSDSEAARREWEFLDNERLKKIENDRFMMLEDARRIFQAEDAQAAASHAKKH